MLGAADYRQRAAEMRRLAEDAATAEARDQLLRLVADYEKLARRAEERAAKAGDVG